MNILCLAAVLVCMCLLHSLYEYVSLNTPCMQAVQEAKKCTANVTALVWEMWYTEYKQFLLTSALTTALIDTNVSSLLHYNSDTH